MTPHRFLLLALLVPAIPAACTARRDPPGGRPLPAAVAVMTETAEVGTDEAFDEYKKDEQIVPAFVARPPCGPSWPPARSGPSAGCPPGRAGTTAAWPSSGPGS